IDSNIDIQTHAVFMEPLVMATPRWEHLKLNGPASFLPKLGDLMPMLRALELGVFTYGNDVFAFYELPQLRTVVLTGTVSSKVTLPWIQLTCLTLNFVETTRCIRILAQTLNLVQCELNLEGGPGLGGLTTVDLPLPRLESLALNTWQTPVEGFLRSLIVPSLRKLALDEGFLDPAPISALESFISRSGCRLQQVCITGHRTTHHESYSRAFPSIPTFSVTGPYVGTTPP
ncbi:hypothetical protein B0H12DRAFT_1149339, partial [Mycena haematopus]